MKNILKTNLNNARNSEHFKFHVDVLNVLTADVANAQHIESLRETYATLFEEEDAAFVRNQSYESTKEIEAKDRVGALYKQPNRRDREYDKSGRLLENPEYYYLQIKNLNPQTLARNID